jgi:D-alanyl-D-alanine carboxypeptidase
VKTGYTKAAGRILVSSALRNGRRIVAVTIDDPNDWQDHAAFLEDGFSQYRMQTVLKQGQEVGVMEIVGGENRQVQLLAAQAYSYPLAPGEEPMLMIPGPGFSYAPAVEGADAGVVYVLINGRAVGKVPVIYGQTVEQKAEQEKDFFAKLRAFF